MSLIRIKLEKLEGVNVYLVPFGDRHLHDPHYLEWLRDYDVVKTINRPEYLTPISFEEIEKYCRRVLNSETDLFLAVYEKSPNRFVGTLRVNSINYETMIADVGILIGRSFWGRGIASAAICTVSHYLFESLGMRKLTAGMMAVNPAMIRVFQKLGFKNEGVFRKQDKYEGQYVDHIYMGCFREEFKEAIAVKR